MPEHFTIRVETQFRASHRLTVLDGSVEPAHEHDWRVTVDVSRGQLDKMGIVMSFQKLKALLDETISDLNEIPLETLDYFQRNSSSAENVAKYIYERLCVKLPQNVRLKSVRVVEEPGCSAAFGE